MFQEAIRNWNENNYCLKKIRLLEASNLAYLYSSFYHIKKLVLEDGVTVGVLTSVTLNYGYNFEIF